MIALRRKSGGLTDPQFALSIVIGVLLFHVVIIIVPLAFDGVIEVLNFMDMREIISQL